jgi:hypothetical protein
VPHTKGHRRRRALSRGCGLCKLGPAQHAARWARRAGRGAPGAACSGGQTRRRPSDGGRPQSHRQAVPPAAPGVRAGAVWRVKCGRSAQGVRGRGASRGGAVCALGLAQGGEPHAAGGGSESGGTARAVTRAVRRRAAGGPRRGQRKAAAGLRNVCRRRRGRGHGRGAAKPWGCRRGFVAAKRGGSASRFDVSHLGGDRHGASSQKRSHHGWASGKRGGAGAAAARLPRRRAASYCTA